MEQQYRPRIRRVPLGAAIVIWNGRTFRGEAAIREWVKRRDERMFKDSLTLSQTPGIDIRTIRNETQNCI
ncbi:MAG: hypothetical protein WC489_06120 [Patescibacteria group bacterium]|jgi:hypothetical protein